MKNKKVSEALPLKPLLSPAQFAALVRIHPESVRRAIRQHRIHAVKFGPSWRISQDVAERVMAEGMPA